LVNRAPTAVGLLPNGDAAACGTGGGGTPAFGAFGGMAAVGGGTGLPAAPFVGALGLVTKRAPDATGVASADVAAFAFGTYAAVRFPSNAAPPFRSSEFPEGPLPLPFPLLER
jgi:hypothetical protein